MKYLIIIFTAFVVSSCTPEENNSQQTKELQSLGINDEGLLQCIVNQATENNISEITTIQNLECRDIEITSLDGLNSLNNLTSILLDENKIEKIDFTNFPTLKSIKIFNQYNLSSINIENSSTINSVDISNVVIDFFWAINLNELENTTNINIRDSILDEVSLHNTDLSKLNIIHSYLDRLAIKDSLLDTLDMNIIDSDIRTLKLDNIQPIDEIYFQDDSNYGLTIISFKNMDNLKRILLPVKNIEGVSLNNLPEIESIILFGNNIKSFVLGNNVLPNVISLEDNPLSDTTIDYLDSLANIEVTY